MVNAALGIVPFWTELGCSRAALRGRSAFARGRALPVPALSQPAHFMTCGRGGTGRRAALRSLWPKGRGSSSLLDRTSIARSGRMSRQFGRGDVHLGPGLNAAQTNDALVPRDLGEHAEVGKDLRGGC